MRRKLRHILPLLSVAVALLIGTWLAVPHDICLTKLMADSGCICLPNASTGNGCGCCTQGSTGSETACASHASADDNESKDTHQPGCFSISSDLSRMTSPERVPAVAPVFAVVAMLPLIVDTATVSHGIEHFDAVDNSSLNKISLYRDNCVYLI